MKSDGERFDHRAFVEVHHAGQSVRAGGADAHELGIGAVALTETDADALLTNAEAGAGVAATGAFAAINVGKARDAFADFPLAFHGGTDLHDLARELVAHDAAQGQRLDRRRLGHVEVRAADAAVFDLQDQIGGAALRVGDGFNGKRFADFLEDGGAHWCPLRLSLQVAADNMSVMQPLPLSPKDHPHDHQSGRYREGR